MRLSRSEREFARTHFVVDSLLLLFLLGRCSRWQTKKLSWARGENVTSFFVSLQRDFVFSLVVRVDVNARPRLEV